MINVLTRLRGQGLWFSVFAYLCFFLSTSLSVLPSFSFFFVRFFCAALSYVLRPFLSSAALARMGFMERVRQLYHQLRSDINSPVLSPLPSDSGDSMRSHRAGFGSGSSSIPTNTSASGAGDAHRDVVLFIPDANLSSNPLANQEHLLCTQAEYSPGSNTPQSGSGVKNSVHDSCASAGQDFSTSLFSVPQQPLSTESVIAALQSAYVSLLHYLYSRPPVAAWMRVQVLQLLSRMLYAVS